MSGILNMVSRFARGRTTGAPARTRRPAAGHGTGRAPHARGNAAGLEGMARKLMRRAR
ncbi:MAG TPA: hypothetical protein VFZ64_09895 [Nocardioidaceae bacterium]